LADDVAAVEYSKIHNTENLWVESDFEAASGVGVHVTEGELEDFIRRYVSTNKERIIEERYKALLTTLKELAANPLIKWADPKLRTEIVNKKFEELLGPKDERDNTPVKKVLHTLLCITNNRKNRKRNVPKRLLRIPQMTPLKAYSLQCSRKDGSEISINQAEMFKSVPTSWKNISLQQVEK